MERANIDDKCHNLLKIRKRDKEILKRVTIEEDAEKNTNNQTSRLDWDENVR